jgi:hypothetical protein
MNRTSARTAKTAKTAKTAQPAQPITTLLLSNIPQTQGTAKTAQPAQPITTATAQTEQQQPRAVTLWPFIVEALPRLRRIGRLPDAALLDPQSPLAPLGSLGRSPAHYTLSRHTVVV